MLCLHPSFEFTCERNLKRRMAGFSVKVSTDSRPSAALAEMVPAVLILRPAPSNRVTSGPFLKILASEGSLTLAHMLAPAGWGSCDLGGGATVTVAVILVAVTGAGLMLLAFSSEKPRPLWVRAWEQHYRRVSRLKLRWRETAVGG